MNPNNTHVVGRSVGRGNPAPVDLNFKSITEWKGLAACAQEGQDPDLWFDEEREDEALEICYQCPVQLECLQSKLTHEDQAGVWGGTRSGLYQVTYERKLRKLKQNRRRREAVRAAARVHGAKSARRRQLHGAAEYDQLFFANGNR